MKPSSKALVTGGRGFLGSHLVSRLVTLGCHVVVVDRRNHAGKSLDQTCDSNLFDLLAEDLSVVLRKNLLDLATFDYVFHLAGSASVQDSVNEPLADFKESVEVTMQLLEAMRATAHTPIMIFPSSAAVYGQPESLPIRETDRTMPISPYGASKLACEHYIRIYSQLYGFRSVCLRPFSVYGPRQQKQVVYDIISKLLANPRQIEVIGDGQQTRDFIYVEDVVDLFILAAADDNYSCEMRTFNCASGTATTIRDLVKEITAIMRLDPEIIYSQIERPGDPRNWSVDISRAKSIGFHPKISLVDGLTEVVHWATRLTGGARAPSELSRCIEM